MVSLAACPTPSPPRQHTCVVLGAAGSSWEDRGLSSVPEPSADLFRGEEYEDAEEAIRSLSPPLVLPPRPPRRRCVFPLSRDRLRGERRWLSYELARLVLRLSLRVPPLLRRRPAPRELLRLSRLDRLGGVRLRDREYGDEDVDMDRLWRRVGVLDRLRLPLGLRPRLRLRDGE